MSEADAPAPQSDGTDYDLLLRSNLERVFNERDPEKRTAAVAELYVDHPIMYEPEAVVRGRSEIVEVAGALLDRFGPTFAFIPHGVAVGHHGFALLHWRGGAADRVVVTGADAAEIIDGKIARLWVLLDPPAG